MPQTSMNKDMKNKKAIPAVKHFFDADAAKKAKKLAKKALNSNFVKHNRGKNAKSGKGIVGAVVAAPVALQVGTIAVLGFGGYMLWKNRYKIQELLGGLKSDETGSEAGI